MRIRANEHLYISNYVIYVIDPIDLVQATSFVGPCLPLSHSLKYYNKVDYNLIHVPFVLPASHPATMVL